MNEKYVQVPVSRIEDEVEYRVRTVVSHVRMAEKHGEPYPSEWVNNQIRAGRERVRFLLSQPPHEQIAKAIASGIDDGSPDDADVVRAATAVLALIQNGADMVPGTCDECGGSGVCGGPPDRYYDCPSCTGVPVDLADTVDDRDPSTIRDVTPPADAS